MKKIRSIFIAAALALLLPTGLPAADIPDGARVTGYTYENCDNGTPEGWDMGMCYIGPSWGVDNTTGIANDTYVAETWLTTHYVMMGSDPHFKFQYKIYDINIMDGTPKTASTANVKFNIEVSDDAGETWQNVYSVAPEGGDMAYEPSAEFQTLDIPLPQYKDKTCQVRIHMPYYMSLELVYCQYLFDNFEIGTAPSADMGVTSLSGTAFPTVGEETSFTVSVGNLGGTSNADYTLKLVDGSGTELAVIPAEEIGAQESKTMTFNWTPDKEGATKIKAVVKCDGDEIVSNDETPWMNVNVTCKDTKTMTIGNNTGESDFRVPVNLYTRNSYTQTVYNENTLGTNRLTIRGLSYDTKFGQSLQTSTFQVYIGTADIDKFSEGAWVDNSSLTKVFDGTVYVDTETQKMEIAFDTPYEYKGGNIIICTLRNDKDFFYGYPFAIDGSAGFAGASMQAYNDDVNAPIDPAAPAGNIALLDFIPVTTFIADAHSTGSVSGTIKGADGQPLEGASVTVSGSQTKAVSAGDGSYTLTGLAQGDYTLTFSAYKYFDKEKSVTVEAGKTVTADIVLDEISRYTVTGFVKDEAGNPIKDVTVQALGYSNGKTSTDEEGKFSIAGIYSESDTYTIRASAPYFKPQTKEVKVDGDIEGVELVLADYLDMPYNVEAKDNGSEAVVTWNEPLHLFRYDDPGQQPSESIGYNGWSASVIGTAFPHKTQLYELQWFLLDNNATHESVNIVISQLDETGWPTRRVIARIDGVPSKDNQWNSYKFEMPISTPNGFFIGLNTGSLPQDIAMTPGTEEYPVEAGRFFGCDDFDFDSDERSRFADLSGHYDSNLLIRVVADDFGEVDYNIYGEDLNNSVVSSGRQSNAGSFDVYRITDGQPEEQWTLVAENVSGLDFTDKGFGSLPVGTDVQYAVVANYASGKSDPSISGIIENVISGIDGLQTASEVKRVQVVSMSGMTVYEGDLAGFDSNTVAAGVYIVRKQYSDGSVTVEKTAIGR